MITEVNSAQMKRYERQIALPEVGIKGQEKLSKAKVLIVGVGGLGCSVLQNLAAAGVGKIGIVDGDVVEETNLHRQHLYTPSNIGGMKVTAAATMISKQNPDVEIITYADYLSRQNSLDITFDYQLVVDCTDNIPARYLINDIAITNRIPMVYASIHKFEGQLTVFNYESGPTYRCLFPESQNIEAIPNCNDSGVLGMLPNVLGALQANEVIKIILGIGKVLSGEILLYNSLDNSFQTIEIQKNNDSKNDSYIDGKSISVADFFAYDNPLLIDIREEYEEPKLDLEHLKNVPLSELDNFLKDVDKHQKIILICQHGNRSELAVEYLIKQGFDHVFHLENGIKSIEKITNGNR